MRTRCRFGSKRRLVATIEWLRLWPNAGPLRQMWHTFCTAGEYREPDLSSDVGMDPDEAFPDPPVGAAEELGEPGPQLCSGILKPGARLRT